MIGQLVFQQIGALQSSQATQYSLTFDTQIQWQHPTLPQFSKAIFPKSEFAPPSMVDSAEFENRWKTKP